MEVPVAAAVAEAAAEVVGVAVRFEVVVVVEVPELVDAALVEEERVGVLELVGVGELENRVSCHSIEEACQSLPARGTTRML